MPTSPPSRSFGGGSEPAGASSGELADLKAAAKIEDCPTSTETASGKDALPDLELDCLGGGRPVRLSGLTGTPTVINLWASWCKPCREELPLLAKADREYGERVRFIGIDVADAAPEAALRLAQESGVTYPQLVDRAGRTRAPLQYIGPAPDGLRGRTRKNGLHGTDAVPFVRRRDGGDPSASGSHAVKLEGSSATLPDWLKPVEKLAASVEAEQLAPRFPHPPANARPAAVLICFADGDNGPELLLTERATTLRNHAGQISFPGGAADADDEDAVTTALREAEEEVGLDPDDVLVFGILPTLWLPPSNFAVTSVLGYWSAPRTLEPVDVTEVGGILHHPIHLLIDPANRFSVEHPTGWRGPAFEVGSDVPLWGFTAGVISRLFEALGWEKPWDDSVTRPLPELL